MKKVIGLATIAALVLVGTLLLLRRDSAPSTPSTTASPVAITDCRNFQEGTVTIAHQTLFVAVADNQEERIQGLSGCSALPDQTGMYFPYPESKQTSYWMKGMLIPLDIVWIADGKVVGILESLAIPPTSGQPPIYNSPQAVDAVLELPAGAAQAYGITPGAVVAFQRK